jgi:hypothetical protein
VLYASVALSMGWSMYYLYVILANVIQSQWESRWIYDGFWDVIYFTVLVPIMILWRPTMNSQQYEYSKVAGDEGDDDETSPAIPRSTDKEEYGSHLKGSSNNGAKVGSSGNKDVIGEVEDALNLIVDTKQVVAKKD